MGNGRERLSKVLESVWRLDLGPVGGLRGVVCVDIYGSGLEKDCVFELYYKQSELRVNVSDSSILLNETNI